jgi:hypothetical protein
MVDMTVNNISPEEVVVEVGMVNSNWNTENNAFDVDVVAFDTEQHLVVVMEVVVHSDIVVVFAINLQLLIHHYLEFLLDEVEIV